MKFFGYSSGNCKKFHKNRDSVLKAKKKKMDNLVVKAQEEKNKIALLDFKLAEVKEAAIKYKSKVDKLTTKQKANLTKFQKFEKPFKNYKQSHNLTLQGLATKSSELKKTREFEEQYAGALEQYKLLKDSRLEGRFMLMDIDSVKKDFYMTGLEMEVIQNKAMAKLDNTILGKYIEKKTLQNKIEILRQICKKEKMCKELPKIINQVRKKYPNDKMFKKGLKEQFNKSN